MYVTLRVCRNVSRGVGAGVAYVILTRQQLARAHTPAHTPTHDRTPTHPHTTARPRAHSTSTPCARTRTLAPHARDYTRAHRHSRYYTHAHRQARPRTARLQRSHTSIHSRLHVHKNYANTYETLHNQRTKNIHLPGQTISTRHT